MKRTAVLLLIGVPVALGAVGCRRAAEPSTAPGTPEDQAGETPQKTDPLEGAKVVGPITVKFLGFEQRGAQQPKGAKFIVRNSSGKPLHAIHMTLRYLDQEGNEIDTFPWSMSAAPVLLKPGQTTTEVMGAGIPDNCASVDIVVDHHR